jgi:maltose/moltooligosaccharide transporter
LRTTNRASYTPQMSHPPDTVTSNIHEPAIKLAGPRSSAPHSHHDELPHLNLGQSLFYSSGGIAGGLVFTMMNNALPLFLLSYTMPLGLPAFFSPGQPIPATIVAMLTNERSFFGGLIQPLVGRLSDHTRSRIGKRSPYVLGGGIGAALSIALLALHPPFWLMVMAVTLTGISLFIALGPYNALLVDIARPAQRGRIGGMVALAGVLGATLFSLLSKFLWDTSRLYVFLISAALVAISMTAVALGVHERPSLILPIHRDREKGLWKEVAANTPLARYVAAMAVYWLGAGAAAPFITRFGVVELKIPESDSFTLLLVIVLATAAGAVIFGFLADRFGKKRVLQPALVLFAVAALAGSQVPNLGWALPVMLLVGLGNAAPTALHIPLLADFVPEERAGALMGFANMIWSVAQPVGSLLAGLLVDVSGSYRGIFIFAAVCMALSAIVMTKVPETTEL